MRHGFPDPGTPPLTPAGRATVARRVTVMGLWVNLLLTSAKLAAGIAGRSGAMVADAVHSMSDFATDVAVLAGLGRAAKPPDRCHDYGHGKYETLAAALIGAALVAVGAGILLSGAGRIRSVLEGETLGRPGWIALAAAALSILTKEWLYRRTVLAGRSIGSDAVIANAWHHRSDALSSVATLLGIGGAILLGEPWRVLDPAAAVVVSVLIVAAAIGILRKSIGELTERSLDDETEGLILEIARTTPGISEPHSLKTRRIGGAVAIDMHVYAGSDRTVAEAHESATALEDALESRFGPGTHVGIHVEPGPAGRGDTGGDGGPGVGSLPDRTPEHSRGGGGMSAVRWTDSLATGIEQIDTQHRELVGRIADLEEAIRVRQGSSKVVRTLGYLIEYAGFHFAEEESRMAACEYPGLEEHRDRHGEFRETLANLEQDFQEEGSSEMLASSIGTFLFNWLVNHIQTVDMRLGDFLRGTGPAAR